MTKCIKMKKILLTIILLAGIFLISMNIGSSTEKIEDFKQACDSGIAVACNKLGLLYYAGRGVKQDSLKAVEFYEKACDGGDVTGCSFLGFMYHNSISIERDDLKAIEFYTKACDGGDTFGCKNLEIIYEKNNTVIMPF
jgi:TPR repeat protein